MKTAENQTDQHRVLYQTDMQTSESEAVATPL